MAGTTGYEFLNQVDTVLLSPEGYHDIEDSYRRLLRRPVCFDQFVQWGKRRVLRQELSAYVRRLADILLRLAHDVSQAWSPKLVASAQPVHSGASGESVAVEYLPAPAEAAASYDTSQLTKRQLADAIVEVAVALPVYRTYVDQRNSLHPDDERCLKRALAAARGTMRAARDALDFLEDVLLLKRQEDLPDHLGQQRLNFIQRFQQLTGPAAAKGVEDTALYAYAPLAARNEVGGDPDVPCEHAVLGLHQANLERFDYFPDTMLGATTHDTKRTADVRARLAVLSELPRLWMGYVTRWRRLNRAHRSRVRSKTAPDKAAEYLFYQSIVGIWPAPDPHRPNQELPDAATIEQLRERLEQYMLKAAREAKQRTSWVNGDQQFEEAVSAFVQGCLATDQETHSPFVRDVNALVGRIARAGFWNSLTGLLIQYVSPGSPDLYQGDELWNFALVDPDNRRAVDYTLRQCLLSEIVQEIEAGESTRRELIGRLVNAPEDGRIKLYVLHLLLRARRDHPELYAEGAYQPLEIEGPLSSHLLAFARLVDGKAAVAVAPRLTTSLVSEPQQVPIGPQVWGDDNFVQLPAALLRYRWTSVLTGEPLSTLRDAASGQIAVAHLLDRLPVALMVGESSQA